MFAFPHLSFSYIVEVMFISINIFGKLVHHDNSNLMKPIVCFTLKSCKCGFASCCCCCAVIAPFSRILAIGVLVEHSLAKIDFAMLALCAFKPFGVENQIFIFVNAILQSHTGKSQPFYTGLSMLRSLGGLKVYARTARCTVYETFIFVNTLTTLLRKKV
jgi:hypothetical protein